MDITKFFDKDDFRTQFRAPFNVLGKTVTTNGHIILFSPLDESYDQLAGIKEDTVSRFKDLLTKAEAAEYKPLKKQPLPAMPRCTTCNGTGHASKHSCEECEGEGKVYFGTGINQYSPECKSCDGDGYNIITNTSEKCVECKGKGSAYPISFRHTQANVINILNVHLDVHNAAILFDESNIEVSNIKEEMLAFKHGDQFGVMMGMRF